MKYNIYKITSDQTDDVYVGITSLTLKKRLQKHKYNYKYYCYEKYRFVFSFLVVCYDDCKIELIEETNDKSREKFWIRKIDCCNNLMNKKLINYICKEKFWIRKIDCCNNLMNKKLINYICKRKDKSCRQGFIWCFHYQEDSKRLIEKASKDKDFLIDFATKWFVDQGIEL